RDDRIPFPHEQKTEISMIAYNHTSLDNLLVYEEASAASDQQLISKEELDAIAKAYPVNLYSPNLFIRIGFFLLTTLIVLMSYGFILLMGVTSTERSTGVF